MNHLLQPTYDTTIPLAYSYSQWMRWYYCGCPAAWFSNGIMPSRKFCHTAANLTSWLHVYMAVEANFRKAQHQKTAHWKTWTEKKLLFLVKDRGACLNLIKKKQKYDVTLFVQVLQCERQASDSDSGPTADSHSITQGPGRDSTDTLSTFTSIFSQPLVTFYFFLIVWNR